MSDPPDVYFMNLVIQIVEVSMITNNQIEVKTTVTVNYWPQVGELYYYGNLDVAKAVQADVKEAGRAFGSSRSCLQTLMDLDLGESVKEVMCTYLSKRANGEVTKLAITTDSNPPDARYIQQGDPKARWGISIDSLEVERFRPPKIDEKAAQEIEAARSLATASKIKIDAHAEQIKTLTEKAGVNNALAVEIVSNTMNPNGPKNIKTINILGLDAVLQSVSDIGQRFLDKIPAQTPASSEDGANVTNPPNPGAPT